VPDFPALNAEGSPRSWNGGARQVAKKLLWPAKRFFDPRFVGLHNAVQEVRALVAADLHAANETATFTGRTLDTLLAHAEQQAEQQADALSAIRAELDSVRGEIDTIRGQIDTVQRHLSFDAGSTHSLTDLDGHVADVLNYEASHEGFAAQSGLWFNPALLLGYTPGHVELRWVNERAVEVPYVFRALGAVPPGAEVLDVGATESSVSLSLAMLGYRVTAVDPRPNPLSHERLEVVVAGIEEWEHEGEFDAVVCLSTIEHLGTGAYGQDATERRLDLEAMDRIRELTRDGGVLVLTTAVGPASADDFGRVYDREGLDRLLEGWDVTDLTLVQRRDSTTWVTIEEPIESLGPDAETVAMVTASKTT
jgi:2-polyprenyl-3-methyl-5-hydroxy-6-metoxy-1,4-benzoquinol methylase